MQIQDVLRNGAHGLVEACKFITTVVSGNHGIRWIVSFLIRYLLFNLVNHHLRTNHHVLIAKNALAAATHIHVPIRIHFLCRDELITTNVEGRSVLVLGTLQS